MMGDTKKYKISKLLLQSYYVARDVFPNTQFSPPRHLESCTFQLPWRWAVVWLIGQWNLSKNDIGHIQDESVKNISYPWTVTKVALYPKIQLLAGGDPLSLDRSFTEVSRSQNFRAWPMKRMFERHQSQLFSPFLFSKELHWNMAALRGEFGYTSAVQSLPTRVKKAISLFWCLT